MARYRFTARDLAPLRPLLDAPFAREVLGAAIPIKRFAGRARQRDEIELPVAVQSREEPDGVPLPEILKAVQAEVPGVTGISVRRGKAVLAHEAPLTAEQKRRIGRLLQDRRRLMALRSEGGLDLAPEDPAALRKVLLEEATPDAEWLRAFRRYAVAELIAKESSRPDALSRQRKKQ
jgi:hypothetical protein